MIRRPRRRGAGRPGNLPAPTTPFVGREAEQREIARLLRDPACRLDTLPAHQRTQELEPLPDLLRRPGRLARGACPSG